jgi:hypothetical protein
LADDKAWEQRNIKYLTAIRLRLDYINRECQLRKDFEGLLKDFEPGSVRVVVISPGQTLEMPDRLGDSFDPFICADVELAGCLRARKIAFQSVQIAFRCVGRIVPQFIAWASYLINLALLYFYLFGLPGWLVKFILPVFLDYFGLGHGGSRRRVDRWSVECDFESGYVRPLAA